MNSPLCAELSERDFAFYKNGAIAFENQADIRNRPVIQKRSSTVTDLVLIAPNSNCRAKEFRSSKSYKTSKVANLEVPKFLILESNGVGSSNLVLTSQY